MEVEGHIMMAEAVAEVAPEAGAPEACAEDATDPPQMQLADEHYEAVADVMDDVDEVEEGKVLSKGDYGCNSYEIVRKESISQVRFRNPICGLKGV
jgi:hypothetical protein